ncbi:MAG: radical SAM protein [Eubacterium sp.]|nr:radical SAM protein [Eubacterium sp.]
MLEELAIKRLNIQLTKRCNQRCRSCNSYQLAEKEKTEEELSLEEIADLIADACGQWNIHNIALTGGEPTIRKDILEIGKIASAYAPNVSVTTNGFYFSEKERVMEMVRGGVNRFSFSYHGIGKQDRFANAAGAEERLRNAIGWIHEVKSKGDYWDLYAKISILFDGENIDDVEAMLDYAESQDMDLYMEIVDRSIPFFCQSEMAGKEELSKEKLSYAAAKIRSWLRVGRRILISENGVQFMMKHYTRQPIRGTCPLGLTDIFIESNGDIRSGCWVLPPVGNIRKAGLTEVQSSEIYRKNIENMLLRNCPGCTCGYLAQAEYMKSG